MTDVELNCKCYIAILKTIELCKKKWVLAHWKILAISYSFTNHTHTHIYIHTHTYIYIYIYIYIYKSRILHWKKPIKVDMS